MMGTMERVNPDVSDLFFNLCHDNAQVMVDGKFDRYDGEKMREQAEWFIGCIERLAFPHAPSVDQLLMDFFGRQ